MYFKTPTWNLILAILACFFSAVSTNEFKTFSSSSSSSSSVSRGSISSFAVKGHQFNSGSHMQPNVIYRKTISTPDQNAKWMSVDRKIGEITITIPIITRIRQIYQYVQPTEYYNIIPSHIFVTIQIAERFRDNAIFILGFLLQSPNSGLTLQQYISLKIIYTALQRKQVQMYRLLPALIKLRGQSKTAQMEGLMFELSKYLPLYYSCSAAFWVRLIHNKAFNPDAVLINGHEEFDLFTSITPGDIQVVQNYNVSDELRGYDQHSKVTEMLLGRVFVKIFKSISVNRLNISQQLFAIILRNLPNFDGDVVYEEYVKFIAEIAWRNGIPNWESMQSNLDSMEIYTLIITLTERVIRNIHVPQIIKQALVYIKDHFMNQHNYVMAAHESYRITETGGLDVTYLLSIISYGEFSYSAVQLKYALLEYIRTHTGVIESVLKGMNKYGYTSIQELLLAFLIRLRTRLPVEDVEIRKTVFGLLSIVQLKIQAWHVRPTTSGLNVKTPNDDQDEDRTIAPRPAVATFLDYKTTPRLEDATVLQRHTTVSGLEDAIFLDQYTTTLENMETSQLDHGDQLTTTPETKGTTSELDHGDYHRTTPESQMTTSQLDHSDYYSTKLGNEGTTIEQDRGDYHTTTSELEGTTSELDHGAYHTITPENKGTPFELDHGDYNTTTSEFKGTTSELDHGTYHTTTPEYKGTTSELDHGDYHTSTPELEGTTSELDHGDYHPTTPKLEGTTSKLDHDAYPTTIPENKGTTSELDHSDYHTSTPELERTTYELDHGDYHTTTPEVEGTTSELDRDAYQTTIPENEGTSEPNRDDHYTTTAETKETISKLDHHITTSGNVELTPQQDQGDLYTTTPENEETTSVFVHGSHYTPTPQTEGTTSELDHGDHTSTPESKPSTSEDHQITTSGYEETPSTPQVVPELPADINPTREIQIELTETGVPIFEFNLKTNHSKNVVAVPSVTCLQKSPRSGDSQNKCDSVTEEYITTHLINILGEDYVQQVLGDKWKEIYATKISFLLALLEKSANNPMIQSHQKLMTIINKYKIALKSVATYVFLPLIVQQRKIETKVIWSTFDYANPSKTYIESAKPEEIGTNTITLPLVNPIQWLSPVDVSKPFDGILPDFPADDPDAHILQPLIEIFKTNEITNLLGGNWNPSVYPNRGALFISVLRTLLTRETVKTNIELYTLIHNYLRAIELPSVYVHIPKTYITTTAHQYHFVAITPRFPVPISDIKTVIPTTLNPENKIQIVVLDSGVPSTESLITVDEQLPLENLVSLPSVTCLQQAPSASNSQDKCEKDVDVRVTQILTQTFGEKYIQMILGDNAKDRYHTRVSLLIALLEKLETHEKIVNQEESLKIIRKYRIALKSVASYILLPLVINYKNINSLVVWLSYDINKPSQAGIVPTPSLTVDNNIITLPLINPKTWVLTVDLMEPFSGLIPKFADAESSFALQIQPLTQLIQTGQIYKLLGSNWKVSKFPNRGALYISALYKLLTVEQVKTNIKLYTLVKHYLKAIELSSINAHISNDYLKNVIHQWQVEYEKIITHFDPIVANVTARNDILLSALIDPNKNLRVIRKSSDRMFVESSRALEQLPIDSLTLPSVDCLQALPDEEDDKYCEHFPDVPILKSLIETLGERGAKDLLEENWNDEYPTMAAFLENFCEKALKNEKVTKNEKLVADIERYRVAIEFASAYIFLPLLANYQEIDAELIWLTYDSSDYIQSHMSLHRADEEENIITLPLVNPKIWLQSVNVEHPFSSFLPNLPSDDPMATKIRPLTNLFNSGEILLLLGKNWTPSNYPSRGALFLSALRTLLNTTTVQSNNELHTLVQNYFNVIRVVSLYVHIPRSWINNEFRKAEYTWNVDVADLSTALPFPQSEEERSYFYYLQSFLHTQNLLLALDIQLPVISTYKAEFLIMIIKRALTSTTLVGLNAELKAALEYYSAKAELALVARGGVVHWVWVRRMKGAIKSKNTLRLDIGKIFTTTLPLSRLNSKVAKVHYFKLIKFMNDNPNFLKTDDFKYARYPNYGQFLRAYLNHLMRRSNIDRNVKKYIKTVVEFIRNTGPGAIPIITSAAKKKLQ